MIQLAFYKGPADDVLHKLSHSAVCWWTTSKYSHVELVIDGLCYSASARDGGVRLKNIDLTTGKWDLVPVLGADALYAKQFYAKTEGLPYDWAGVMRFVMPKLPISEVRYYCTEWCAEALQYPEIEYTPEAMYRYARYLLD